MITGILPYIRLHYNKGGLQMEAFLANDWAGIILIGFGTLFLLGEILVNLRGIFALLGITFVVLYFYVYTPSPSAFAMMFIIYLVGIILILIDGKLINDGTLATLGLAGMILSVSFAAPNLTAGLYAVISLMLGTGGSLVFLKIFPPRNMWGKIALKDRLTKEAGYTSLNVEHEKLVGKKGVTQTNLRPVGTVVIEDENYSAISDAQWIAKDTNVVVVDVDGTRILVKEDT